MTERTPWRRLLALSQSLGVAPAQFWRLSLREWRVLVAPAHESLTRAAFDALARRFPDETK
jgi:uncharacterized phage protein (TIGR02216 family)